MEMPTRGETQDRIDALERQGESDRRTISGLIGQIQANRDVINGLQARATEDRQSISDGLVREVDLGRDVDRLAAAARVDRDVIALLQAEGQVSRALAEHLELALVSARRIGGAMGIMMARYRITDDVAFDFLKTASQNSQRKLRDIADEVMLTGTLPDMRAVQYEPPSTSQPSLEQ